MPGMQVIREGDFNIMKGVVMPKTGSQTVIVDKRPVAMKARTQVVPHPGPVPPIHPMNPIAKGDKTVLVEGMPIAFVTVPDMCLHPMMKNDATVLVSGTMG
jgi:uncharacterized Zn-binding protein involved in type VI secretion